MLKVPNRNRIREKHLTYRIACGVLLTIVGFFGLECFDRLVRIQRDLIGLQIAIVELKSQVITRDDVKEIVRFELLKQEAMKHANPPFN